MTSEQNALLKIVFIEDRKEDFEIVRREMRKVFKNVQWFHVTSLEALAFAIRREQPDLVLSDYKMLGFTGMDALRVFQQESVEIPFIIVTGSIDEDTAVSCLKAGATDYVTKENLFRLIPSVNNALELFISKREQEQTQKAFAAEQRKFRHAFEYANVGMCLLSPEGSFLQVNNEFCSIVGYSKEELTQKTVYEVTYAEDLELTVRFYKQGSEEFDSKAEIQKRYRHKDGHPVWVQISISLVRDETGNPEFFITHVRDISRRKRDEDLILKLSKSVEQSPVMVAITDLNGRINYINPKLSEVTGYTMEELANHTFSILKSGMQDEQFYKNLWDTITSGKIWRGEFCNRKKNGDLYWESATITAIQQSDQKPLYYLAIKEDITEWKHLQQSLIEAKELAEASDRLKTSFLANVSHEIRTPMNGILGFSELLEDSGLSRNEQQEYIQVIRRSGQQLLSIVDDILDISRIESGQTKIFQEPFDLKSLLEDIYLTAKTKIEISKKPIHVQLIQPVTSSVLLLGDRMHLTQILENLVSNAVKFTEKGQILIGCHTNTDRLEFYIKDTGIGINKDAFQSIFERFRQENDSVVRKYGGTGLGLSIAKGLVELLKGSIRVDSTVGTGSTFSFDIPLVYETNPIVSETPKTSQHVCRGELVLVVEDIDENYALIHRFLTRMQLKPIRAENGKRCLDICRETSLPSLILLDLGLPDIHGLEVARIVRKSHPKLPIIAQTAHASEDDRKQCLEAGCNAFLSKPLQYATFADTVTFWLYGA